MIQHLSNQNSRSPTLSLISSWNRDGIQFKDEDQKNGSMLYLNLSFYKYFEERKVKYGYFVPSIWRTGPDTFSMNMALNRVSDGL